MKYADQDQISAGSHLDDSGNESTPYKAKTEVKVTRGSDLKNQDFPLEVRFGGGWKQVHFVSTTVFRGNQIVQLWDRDSQEIAKIFPDTEIRIRVEAA